MEIDIDFLFEELLLEGLGGPDFQRVRQLLKSICAQLIVRDLCISEEQESQLFNMFSIYKHTIEYDWVVGLPEARRLEVIMSIIQILGRNAAKFDKPNTLKKLFDSFEDNEQYYYWLYTTKDIYRYTNETTKSLIKLAPKFNELQTLYGVIRFLKLHSEKTEFSIRSLFPWFKSLLGLKAQGRGYARVDISRDVENILIHESHDYSSRQEIVDMCKNIIEKEKGLRKKSAKHVLSEIAKID